MHLRSLTSRRPSAAFVIACAALFVSLGGVGYAAVAIPNNSVGTAQLKTNAVTYQKIEPSSVGNVRLADGGVSSAKLANDAVTYQKIQPSAVGAVRANLNQLQARVSSTCGAGSAIGALSSKGAVTCNSALPAEYGTATNAATISDISTAVTTRSLPAGPTYLAFANPTFSVTSAATAQRVTIACTFAVGTATQSHSVVVRTDGTAGDLSTGSIPFQLAGTAGAASVACQRTVAAGVAPVTTATAAINALDTASSN